MKSRSEEFRAHIITERESWMVDNLDKNPSLTVEQNAAMIEPTGSSDRIHFAKSFTRKREAGAGFDLRDARKSASGKRS